MHSDRRADHQPVLVAGGAGVRRGVAADHEDQRSRVEGLVEAVRAAHSYEVPEITAVPIVAGLPDYLAWIDAETSPRA
jgi:CutA1 divalent ion tolerance protein